MTGPAVAPAVEAPVFDQSTASGARDFAISETLSDFAKDQAGQPRDPETGKFVAKDGTPVQQAKPAGEWNTIEETPIVEGQPAATPAKPLPVPQADGDEAEGEALELPEGYVAAPPLAADRIRELKVFDADGEIVPPDLTWELSANGKTRKLPTDKMVEYARMGVYNHEREVAMQDTQQRAQHVQRIAENLQQQQREFYAERERLLSDPDYLVRAIADYERQNTPEARAHREREQVEQDRQSLEMERAGMQAEAYLSQEVEPALETIHNQLPTVSREELAARLLIFADPYRRDGVLLPQGFAPVAQYIVRDLVPWARQLHDSRSEGTTSTPPKGRTPAKSPANGKPAAPAVVDPKVAKLQLSAQKAKRTAAAALKPPQRSMPDSQSAKPIRTSKDAEDAVVGGTLAAMRGG